MSQECGSDMQIPSSGTVISCAITDDGNGDLEDPCYLTLHLAQGEAVRYTLPFDAARELYYELLRRRFSI